MSYGRVPGGWQKGRWEGGGRGGGEVRKTQIRWDDNG